MGWLPPWFRFCKLHPVFIRFSESVKRNKCCVPRIPYCQAAGSRRDPFAGLEISVVLSHIGAVVIVSPYNRPFKKTRPSLEAQNENEILVIAQHTGQAANNVTSVLLSLPRFDIFARDRV